jgi:DNA uptake protein ComE-like DNA-binding protein
MNGDRVHDHRSARDPAAIEDADGPKPTADAAASTRNESAHAGRPCTQSRVVIIVLAPLFAWAVCHVATGPSLPSPGQPGIHAATVLSRIDPNTAPWWELASLPRIGETMARRIVEARTAHRGDAPAFTRLEDLDQIRGIGPKTLEAVAPHLIFPDGTTHQISNY